MGKYKFALLGAPVEHSLSPEIHRIFAEGCGIDIRNGFEYIKTETDKPLLKETVERLKSEGFSGFNCTMPLKEEIMKYIDEKSEQSKLLGVCNTVKINNGKLHAFTTDGDGMVAGLRYNGVEVAGKNIVVIGAGGSAKSVILSLVRNNAGKITALNRSVKKLDFGIDIKFDFDLLTLENIERVIGGGDILINMSRLGMRGFDEAPAFGYDFLKLMKRGSAVADAVYEPLNTRLLESARENNLKAIDGFWMLVYQGVLAFEIWTGMKVPEEYIEKAHGVIKR